MVKHRRLSDNLESNSNRNDDKSNPTSEEISPSKSPTGIKSIILSGTKYGYIITAVALFSGIFTPLTLGVETEEVIFGMFAIFLGLGGGIMIFLGIKNQKYTTIMICGGLVMIIISLILIFELAKHSLFG